MQVRVGLTKCVKKKDGEKSQKTDFIQGILLLTFLITIIPRFPWKASSGFWNQLTKGLIYKMNY